MDQVPKPLPLMNRPPFAAAARTVIAVVLLSLVSAGALFAQLSGAVVITFHNLSTRTVNLNTAVPGQAMKSVGQMGPGEVKSVQSVPGQNWILLLTNGKVFAEYRTTAVARQHFTLNQDAGVAGPPPAPLTGPQSAAGSTGSRITPQQAQQIVNFHDAKRAEVGCGKVVWSPIIAQFAQQRADTIARTKKFGHLPQGQNPYGENLAQGTGAYSVVAACEGWYAEKAKMPRNVRVMTVNLFNQGVGHYTQMVWKGSNQIGAGIAQNQQGGFTFTVVVCCYNPPGNVIGGAIY